MSLSSFKKVRNSGLKAILLKSNDYLFNALHTTGNDKIIFSANLNEYSDYNPNNSEIYVQKNRYRRYARSTTP